LFAELVRTTMAAAVSEAVEAVPPAVAALAKGAVPTLRLVGLPGATQNKSEPFTSVLRQHNVA